MFALCPKLKVKRDEAVEGLKVLICAPDSAKGQGETGVTVISLTWGRFISANALSGNAFFDYCH